MNYAVVWRRRAQDQLTALWIRAANRSAFAMYTDQIERILQRDPRNQGESRGGDVRLWFYRPLCVLYRINEAALTVEIGRIKWVGR